MIILLVFFDAIMVVVMYVFFRPYLKRLHTRKFLLIEDLSLHASKLVLYDGAIYCRHALRHDLLLAPLLVAGDSIIPALV